MRIVVLFGGKSVEHEISIISANQVMKALQVRHQVIPVYVSKNNEFYYDKKMEDLDYFKSNKRKISKLKKVTFKKDKDRYFVKGKKKQEFDLIFPIVHGKGAEDGSLLSYFKFQGFPIVGNNHVFYAVAQDKALTKRLLDGLEIENVRYKVINRNDDYTSNDFEYPCIVKPNNLGSSLGIAVANNFIDLERAVSNVFRIDSEVLVEEYLQDCKEYNIAVLNHEGVIETSEVEEVSKGEIFTFEEKYLSGGKEKGMASSKRGSSRKVSDKKLKKEIEKIAKKIYLNLEASGVIRIDFLYKDKLYVNEINSIPGSYAYYLWESKYDFSELLEIVINEAKRNIFFENRDNELIKKNLIFKL